MSTVPNNAAAHKGPVGPLRHRCTQCLATGVRLFRCSGCHAVRYCSREHQAADRRRHKIDCNLVKKERALVAKEEAILLDDKSDSTDDSTDPDDAFQTYFGLFWLIESTRPYMEGRTNLAESLRLVGTLDSVREAYDHMWEMLFLGRADATRGRDIMAAMMLRLDLDQECYDLIKWWQTNKTGLTELSDVSRPFLNLRGADVMEDPSFVGHKDSLSHTVAIMLLKLKLLVDIRNINIARKISSTGLLLPELWAMIEAAVVRSPLSVKLFVGKSPETLLKAEKSLVRQVGELGRKMSDINGAYMYYLFKPEIPLGTSPPVFATEIYGRMAYAMHLSYAAWWEMEGVLDLLADARECAARALEQEMPQQTTKEFVEEMSLVQLWHFLYLAVKNASYLGPWSERPSEQHLRDARERAAFNHLETCAEPEWDDDEAKRLYEAFKAELDM